MTSRWQARPASPQAIETVQGRQVASTGSDVTLAGTIPWRPASPLAIETGQGRMVEGRGQRRHTSLAVLTTNGHEKSYKWSLPMLPYC